MNIQSVDTPLSQWTGDYLGIGFFEDQIEVTGALADLDEALSGGLTAMIEDADFKGKSSAQVSARFVGTPIKQVMLVGLGSADSLKLDGLRKAAASVVKTAKKQRCRTVGLSLQAWNDERIQSVQAIAEGVENIEQVNYLNELGCEYAQGFYYSRPLSFQEIEANFLNVISHKHSAETDSDRFSPEE